VSYAAPEYTPPPSQEEAKEDSRADQIERAVRLARSFGREALQRKRDNQKVRTHVPSLHLDPCTLVPRSHPKPRGRARLVCSGWCAVWGAVPELCSANSELCVETQRGAEPRSITVSSHVYDVSGGISHHTGHTSGRCRVSR
jgi:hypothetical protein